LVQETLLRALEGLDGFEGKTEAQLRAWLVRILRNLAVDRIRHETAQKCDPDLEEHLDERLKESSARHDHALADSGPSPSKEADLNEQRARVQQAKKTLPEDHQEVLTLRSEKDLSIPKIAEQMRRPKKEIARLYREGLEMLRQLLGPENH
jgi:RNA polymerase sigma factor (sigma-70 family)